MIVESEGRDIELNEEQIKLYEALTKLQRGVAIAYLQGMEYAEAHLAGGGTCANEANRSKLGRDIVKSKRVQQFLNAVTIPPESKIANAIASRDEILQDLTVIARTQIHDVVDFDDEPCVSMEGLATFQTRVRVKSIEEIPEGARKAIKSVKQTKNGLEIQMYDTLQARKQIADLSGYNAPTKTEVSGPGGKPIEIKEISDEELEERLKELGMGRHVAQLGSKSV